MSSPLAEAFLLVTLNNCYETPSKRCNGCWINFHRKYDIILLRNLERVLPKRVIEMFYGKYQWCANSRLTYRNYFKSIKK